MSRPYKDDPLLLQAIGEVVVAASRLEYAVARLAWLLGGPEVRQSLKSVGKVHEAMTKLKQLDEGRLTGLVAQARILLDLRHELVHSISQWESMDGAEVVPVWWHPKSDGDLTIDVGRVRELAHELRRSFGLFAREINALEEGPTEL